MASKSILCYSIKQAILNPHESKLCDVLYKGGSIIRASHNTSQHIGYRADVFEFAPTRHAEQSVLHNVPRDILSSCSMLVVRVNRKNEVVSGKPCRACLQAIQKSGISKLEFSNYHGEIEKINPQLMDINNWKKEISPFNIK